AAARAAAGDRPFRAAFVLDGRQIALLDGPLGLDLGVGVVALPAPAPPAGEPAEESTVVDRAELAERRARRAEEAERTTAQRAADAEAALDGLELDMARLEVRLRDADVVRGGGEPVPSARSAPSAPEPAVPPTRDEPARSLTAGLLAAERRQREARERGRAAP